MEELKAPPFVTHVHIVDKWKPHLFLLISTKMNGLSMRAYAVRMSKLKAQSFFDCTTCYFRLFVRSEHIKLDGGSKWEEGARAKRRLCCVHFKYIEKASANTSTRH